MRNFLPDIVLWIVSSPAQAMRYHGHWIHPCSQPYDGLYARDLRRDIEQFGATGARVVLTTTAYLGTKHGDRYTDCDNRLRRTVAAQTHTPIVDLFAHVCPSRKCIGKVDGVKLRPDGTHYTGAGGALIARWLVSQLAR